MLKFSNENENIISINGKFNIYKCTEIKKELLNILETISDKKASIYLDFTGLESIDLSAIQLLISFKNEINNQGGQLYIKKEADPFFKILNVLNMHNYFEIK